MSTAAAALSALAMLGNPETLFFLVVGAAFGLAVGIVPGLSGLFAMAMAVSFLYGMEAATGIVFLLAAHATVAQGGGLTAILFSIPGTGQNAATLLDGPPMRDRGEAGIAVGAAMTACFFGATFGAVALALLIPVLRELVLSFGPSEIFLISLLGLIFVAVLGGRDLRRALVAGLFGLLLSMVGVENASYQPRFTFGVSPLSDGLSLVPVVLGLFAVAEMMQLWTRGGRLLPAGVTAPDLRSRQAQLFKGAALAVRHWWLVLRCSAIGTVMGLIPGLGSAPASFVAYGHARQYSPTRDSYGKGNVEGVIAPEAANDAVEGGALASTVTFGVPGSSSMAILLSGLTILGLETGPRMLGEDLDILFLMIFTIILGNLFGAVAGMAVANPMVHLTTVRASFMVPTVLAVVICGAYAGASSLSDIATVLLFGGVGYLCTQLRYSRAALLIGFVLGNPIEYNLTLAVQIDGPLFFLAPVPLAMIAVGLLFVAHSVRGILRDGGATVSPRGNVAPEAHADSRRLLSTEVAFLCVVIALTTAAIAETLWKGRIDPTLPLIVALPLIALALAQLRRTVLLLRTQPAKSSAPWRPGPLPGLVATGALLWLGILFVGHYVALFIFGAVLTGAAAGENWRIALPSSLLAVVALWLFFAHLMGIEMYDGLVYRYFAGYRDF